MGGAGREPVSDYDSTADTLRHSQRVGELLAQLIDDLLDRAVRHDRSKTQPPEKETFDRVTPRLATSTYGSDEYKGYLADMGPALAHHYKVNRHHPEHFPHGVNGMTLVDLAEMLADWRAATERHNDGDLIRSLEIQRVRFGLSDQLAEILWNTARLFGWITTYDCGHPGRAPNGDILTCTDPYNHLEPPHGGQTTHVDGKRDHVEWPAHPVPDEHGFDAASVLNPATGQPYPPGPLWAGTEPMDRPDPFCLCGAPWVDGRCSALTAELTAPPSSCAGGCSA